MKKLFNIHEKWNILKRMNFLDEFKRLKRNRDIFVFLIFLFVSTTFWLLNALRDTYVASFSFDVNYVNVPDNEIIVKSDNERFELKVRGIGFSILRQYASSSLSSPSFDVSRLKRIKHKNSEYAYLLARDQRNHFSNQLYVGIELIDIIPDTVFIALQKLVKKKIPITTKGEVKLEKQFLMSGPIVFDPDSVEVTGPKSIIDTISAILTKPFVFEKVRDTLIRSVSLVTHKNLSISSKSTSMLIPVEPFTESSMQIPIDVVGIADTLRCKTFPSEITITFRTGLSRFGKIHIKDFRAVIDASAAYTDEKPQRLRVKIDRMPQGIYSMDYSPLFVEYLIERKR